MNILIVTDEGSMLGLADRLNSEGHSVHVFARKSIGGFHSRLFQEADNIHKAIGDCKFVLCDIDSWAYLDERVKNSKRPVIGSHALATVPNKDAIKQYQLFKRFQVPIPKTEIYEDTGDAIKAAMSWEASRTVIRYGEREFRCDYKDWLAWAMFRVPVGQKILFQELAIGYEAVLTGWFDGFEWVDAFSIAPSINFDLSKFAAVAPIKRDHAVIQETFGRLAPYFRHWEYRGPVHLDVVLGEKIATVQNMHIGWKFPLDYTILEFVQGDLSKFLNGIAYPNNFEVKKTRDFVGVVQSVCVGDDLNGAPILGLNPERLKHMVFNNALIDVTDGTYQVGPKPIKEIVTAFAHGPSIGEMCTRVYQTVESVKFPEKHYNGNLAAAVTPSFEKFRSWGYTG